MMTTADNNTSMDVSGFTLPATYCINVKGVIDERYAGYFGDMVLSAKKNSEGQITSILTGKLKDQSELMGVMNALYSLHLTIVSIKTLDKESG